MTESDAIVTAIDGDFAVIEIQEHVSACGSCHARGSCGKSAEKPKQYSVRNTMGAAVGDTVVLRAPDGAVLKAAGLSYLMPLLFLFAGALGATHWLGDGWPAVLGALFGLAIGFVMLRIMARRRRSREPWLSLALKRHVVNFDKET